jgi:ferritin-like protein
MADSSMGLHEAKEDMTPGTLDRHRGIVSLMEELEAMDWYQQRIDAAGDPELAAVLAHNRDEETEHAAMSLEWLRRQDPVLDQHLRDYLFTSGSIVGREEEIEGGGEGAGADGDGSLGIGSLR